MKKISTLISRSIQQSEGIDISMYDDSFIEKSLQKRLSATQSNSTQDYLNYFEGHADEKNHFLDSLQISYSEFFRNPLTFSLLERIILPQIIQKKKDLKRKEIRIWSAACAGGQESYSIAILLNELINNNNEEISFRIFATDQSSTQINEASKGNYTENLIQYVSLKRINQWFTKKGTEYIINKNLKNNIDFSTFDLLNNQFSCPPASIFGDFDLIICANLLFYYKPKYQKIILEKTMNCLTSGGFLIVGEAERSILMNHNFREVYPQSAIFTK
jgi:chemotaxis protein methyltransferase CheR